MTKSILAALAISLSLSGAALAASVGAQNTKWYETLFAISGLRLGAWMPNPKFLNEQAARGGRRWFEPGLPRVRRLSYLLRELFAVLEEPRDRLVYRGQSTCFGLHPRPRDELTRFDPEVALTPFMAQQEVVVQTSIGNAGM